VLDGWVRTKRDCSQKRKARLLPFTAVGKGNAGQRATTRGKLALNRKQRKPSKVEHYEVRRLWRAAPE
jgi:hypothetical protein